MNEVNNPLLTRHSYKTVMEVVMDPLWTSHQWIASVGWQLSSMGQQSEWNLVTPHISTQVNERIS